MMAPAKKPQTEIEALQLELILCRKKEHQQRRQQHGLYLFFSRPQKRFSFDRKCVRVCAWVCVCTVPRKTPTGPWEIKAETHLFFLMQSETHLIVKWRLMISKRRRRRSKRQESRPHVGQLSLQSDLSNFIFVLVNIISCSGKYTPRISQVSWKGRRKAGYSLLRLSLIPWDRHDTDIPFPYPIRSVQETLCSSSMELHSWWSHFS